MGAVLRVLAAILLPVAAVLLSLCGGASSASALLAPPDQGLPSLDCNAGRADCQLAGDTTAERGSPTTRNPRTTDDANGDWLGGAAPRPSAGLAGVTTIYTAHGPPARVLQVAGTTLTVARVDAGGLSSLAQSDVAANAADEVPAFARSQYSRMSTSQRAGALEKSPTCPYCGTRPSTQGDHITSLKRDWESGGWADDRITRSTRVHSSDNLIGACQPCNGSKGALEIGPGAGQWWPSGWPSGVWWPFGGPVA